MDLIGQLAGALDVDSGTAEKVAGSVLGVVRHHAPEGALSDLFDKAGPLLSPAQGATGDSLSDVVGTLGGLLGGSGGGAGGILQGAAALQGVTGVLEKLGVSPELAAKAVPLVVSFIRSSLGDEGFAALLQKVPFLEELSTVGSGKAGGLGGLLGGFLK